MEFTWGSPYDLCTIRATVTASVKVVKHRMMTFNPSLGSRQSSLYLRCLVVTFNGEPSVDLTSTGASRVVPFSPIKQW